MDNIDEARNSIIISLATCGGIVKDSDVENCVELTISQTNLDKAYPQKEVYKTYTITEDIFDELKIEAYELHTQIEGMIEEEETKANEVFKEKEKIRKKEEEEKEARKQTRALNKKKPKEAPSVEIDKGD